MKKTILILLILLIIGIGSYVLGYKKTIDITQQKSEQSEESSVEIFKKQPGEVKSVITKSANQWELSIDLLTHNPNWVPGVDSTGGFFINQNSRIRNLIVDKNTKTYGCPVSYADGRYEPSIQNNANYIANIETGIKKSNAEFGYTAYFDIKGTYITAIYTQCLP